LVCVCFFVSTSASNCLERCVSEMTCCMSSGTLNPTHSLAMSAWWQLAVSMSEHCYCHRKNAAVKTLGKASHTAITVFLFYRGNMLSAVRNTVILQCFDSVGWVTGWASGIKSSATTIPKSVLLGTGLIWVTLEKWAIRGCLCLCVPLLLSACLTFIGISLFIIMLLM